MKVFLGGVWPFFYLLCQEWDCEARCTALFRESGRGLKSGRIPPPLCLASTSRCYRGMRPVPTGCSVCAGWASDAAEMLGKSHLEMWWELSTSAVWRSGHAGKGMVCVKVVLLFFQRTFFHNTLVFSFSLEVKVGHIDGSWPAAWKENGWRERWRRVVLKLWRK